MGTYKLKNDLYLGVQTNDIGISTPVNLTKGQTVEGSTISKIISGKLTNGIEYKVPSKRMGVGRPLDGMDTFFIQLDALELISSPNIATTSNTTSSKLSTGNLTTSKTDTTANTSNTKSGLFTSKKLTIALSVVIIIYFIVKAAK